MRRHLIMLHEFYGSEPGARIARKHMQAYMKRWRAEQLIPSFMAIEEAAGQLIWLERHSEYLLTQAKVTQPNLSTRPKSPPDAVTFNGGCGRLFRRKICRLRFAEH